MPRGFYAQESRFVTRKNRTGEGDGWILSYVFDESQLNEFRNAGVGAKSELWVIEAKKMKEVVCKVKLPQRVPYGLHGNWFSEQDIQSQRPIGPSAIFQRPEAKLFGRAKIDLVSGLIYGWL